MSLVSPKRPDEMPTGEHYAALVFDSFTTYTEGDERSRTHPGHGRPGGSETHQTVEYRPFKNKEELDAFVIKQEKSSSSKQYVILKAQVAKIELETKIKLS